MPAFLSGGGYVDSKGVVDAKAVARAASAVTQTLTLTLTLTLTRCEAPEAVRRRSECHEVVRALERAMELLGELRDVRL